MNAVNRTTREVKFRPRARVVEALGGELIKDEMAGIIELVKNAYDADAKRVTITFKHLKDVDGACIALTDDGHGMALKTLLDDWLSPATAGKERQETSPGGRAMLGRKGVGRFSAMRLGQLLVVETKPDMRAPNVAAGEVSTRYRLSVDWQDFRDPDRYLEEVPLRLQSYKDAKRSDHWTRLEIRGLTEQWDETRLRRLLRELRLLLSPVPVKQQVDFQIELDIVQSGLDPEFVRGFPGVVTPYGIPDVADYFVTASIDAAGSFEMQYRRYLYAGTDQEEETETAHGSDIREKFAKNGSKYPLPLPCGPVAVQLHIWDRDPEILQGKVDRLKDAEKMGIRAIRRFLDEVSGVAIHRDGFRVRPYGDAEHDWLALAQRRVQLPVQSIGPNQLFGLVEISSIGNPLLRDKSSREGLQENQAFETLRHCVSSVLSWCEPFRYRFRKRHSLGRPSPKSTRALVEARERALDDLESRLAELVRDKRARNQVSRLISTARKTSDSEHERLSQQAQIMHDNHALGLLARFIIHEGRNLDSSLDSALNNLERVVRMGRTSGSPRVVISGDDVSVLDRSLHSSRGVEQRLDALIDQLDPLTRPRRTRRPHIVVEDALRTVLSILAPLLHDASIEVDVPKGAHRVVAWQADVFHALYNILHNSVYWVQQVSGPRHVSVQVRQSSRRKVANARVCIETVIADSGPGVSAKSADSVFDLGYTEKPGGYGVGLFIAREAIERSGGSIDLMNAGEPSARFRVILEGVG
jgi:signal transduction histidine kinase